MEFEEVLPKKHKCNYDGCEARFDRPYKLARHYLTHSNFINKPYKCVEDGCNKAYTSKNHLERHVNTAHRTYNADEVYSCPKCFKEYANPQNLKRHYKIEHVERIKEFSCKMCHLNFKHKHQLNTHMYKHTGEKSFSCPMCPKQFVSLSEQKKHVRNHKTFKCEHCFETFTRWADVVQHRQTNHQSEVYTCNDCGKTFKHRQHIIRHVKVHIETKEVPLFICPYENCLRHYSRNSNLKQHVLVKHEGHTFNCHICDAKLSTKAKLSEHVLRHNRPPTHKPPKTLETGRKKRKDASIPRSNIALKLAGLPYPMQDQILPHQYNVQRQENASVNQLCTVGM